jgi:hypothetical protein
MYSSGSCSFESHFPNSLQLLPASPVHLLPTRNSLLKTNTVILMTGLIAVQALQACLTIPVALLLPQMRSGLVPQVQTLSRLQGRKPELPIKMILLSKLILRLLSAKKNLNPPEVPGESSRIVLSIIPPLSVPHVISSACTVCRRLKMKCVGADNPPCKRCVTGGHQCVFEESNRGKRTSRHDINPKSLNFVPNFDFDFQSAGQKARVAYKIAAKDGENFGYCAQIYQYPAQLQFSRKRCRF